MADTIMWSRAKQVNTNLVIKLNGGTTEGTNLFTYNGSGAKTINITASSIGAASSSAVKTYSAGTGLALSGTTFNHKNSITAGNGGPTANTTVNAGGTFTVPYFTYDAQGHITGRTNRTITLNSALGNFEPVQGRGQWNSGDSCFYVKCGYSCYLHCSRENAEDVVKTLSSSLRPKYAITISGWCVNETSGNFYPCLGTVLNTGEWTYLSAIDSASKNNLYYIYHRDNNINRLTNFLVYLTGAWATNTNGY